MMIASLLRSSRISTGLLVETTMGSSWTLRMLRCLLSTNVWAALIRWNPRRTTLHRRVSRL